MEPNQGGTTLDRPFLDGRSTYDFEGGATDIPRALSALPSLIAGEVRFDEYTKQLYATDASAYEVTPLAVVFPTSTADVAAVVRHCHEHTIPVLPRGGGTSLAGQAVNEAVILDFTRNMGDILEIDPDARKARAQPGALLGDINRALLPHGLKFAPDPAWGDKSALGGAIGNNSTGSHSLKYGKTDAYILECEVVLSNGTITTFGEIDVADLEELADPAGNLKERIYATIWRFIDHESDHIAEAYPSLKRNVSGYNLDRLIDESASGRINVARVLAGSEGTLAIVTEATIGLEPIPATKAIGLLTYDDLLDAMGDVGPILAHEPAAVEVMDDVLLELASATEEFRDVVSLLPESASAVLLVEFYADSDEDGMQKVADLITDRVPDVIPTVEPSEDAAEMTGAPCTATGAFEAHDPDSRSKFWKMRKSGLPILLSRTSDEKHIAFIEDTAVPPQHLQAYVAEFQELLEGYGTFASFYAHAGPGCLHIRPLINTKTVEGVTMMESIANDATDLVVKYNGAVSGEHGDGRARSQWNRKLYGDHVFELFQQLKHTFDPDWILNPGQVCGNVKLTEHLRFGPEYAFEAGFNPSLVWNNENGFQGMVELCHGCGGCRGPQETTGGVMCPTYRAASEEITSTRGRANLLRQAMNGTLPVDEVFSEAFHTEVLDLCIGCKGCAKDCPSGVDMAKLKVELAHENHRRNGSTFRDRLFANVDRVAALGSKTAPISNWVSSIPGAGFIAEKTIGIARERSFPTFYRRTLLDWFSEHESIVTEADADRRVLLFPDTFTTYNYPQSGIAAVRMLEAANVYVDVPTDTVDSGRSAYSMGFLDDARERARVNVTSLAPKLRDGWDLVVVEPSEAVMIQSDYRDLLIGADVETVSSNTFGILEFINVLDLPVQTVDTDTVITYHGHCHQKATNSSTHAATVLSRAGYDVDVLDSGCCGMAGSFGYEAEHYSLSKAIGRILFDQVDQSPGDAVVASGASCRSQLGTHLGDQPIHPIELLATGLER